MFNTRPTNDSIHVEIAELVASRGTCTRRKVGAVLVDSKNRILSTGFNGVMKGADHCIDKPCPGATLASGTSLDVCEAIHAEMNAKQNAGDLGLLERIHTLYCTVAPCMFCVKEFLNTSLINIIYMNEYPNYEKGKLLWEKRSDRQYVSYNSLS